MACSYVKLGRWGIQSKMRELMLSFSIQFKSTDLEALDG